MEFRSLEENVLVASGEVRPADLADAPARGVTLVVNNRPDGEEPGQATSAELEQAARAGGMDYVHIPVAGDFSDEKIAAQAAALAGAGGKALLFCRSGTRSTYLWTFARARDGVDPDVLAQQAARAGYSLAPLMNWLRRPS